jgi:hypothetical protein
MDQFTRKKHSRLHNFIPKRNASKTLKRGKASRYLVPKRKEFRWANAHNLPLTSTSSNNNVELNENEQANYTEYNNALRKSRLRVLPFKPKKRRLRLGPYLSRKVAEIMAQHNEPEQMKAAINANINLHPYRRKLLRKYIDFIYQENTSPQIYNGNVYQHMNVGSPPPQPLFIHGLTPKLAAVLEGLFTRHSNPINMVDELAMDIFLTPDEREVLLTKILENFPDE